MESSSRDDTADDGRVAAALRQRKSEMARMERARARAGAEAFESALREAREEFMGQLRARYDARRRRMDATTSSASTAAGNTARARDGRSGTGHAAAMTPGWGRKGTAPRVVDVGSDASFALGSTLDDVRRRRREEKEMRHMGSVLSSPLSPPVSSSAMHAREPSSASASPRRPGAPVFASRSSPSPLPRATHRLSHHRQPRPVTPDDDDDDDARDLLESVADMVRRAESLRAQLSPSRFRD